MTLLAHGPHTRTVHTVHTVPRAPATTTDDFAYETDLGPAVIAWLAARRKHHSIAEEVDSGVGIADLVLGTSRRARTTLRPAVTDSTQLRLLELAQKPVTEGDLRSWAPGGWSSLRRRTLEPLLDAGLLTRHAADNAATYRATVKMNDPFDELTAVELKLTDWRRAIAQAGRYRLFADRSYIAMPHKRVTSALIDEAVRNDVGVLSVHAIDGVYEVTTAAVRVPLQPQRRRVTSELVLAAALAPSSRRAGAPLL